ncbi:ATP-dependent DNA ligase [Nocardia niigatensis]
MLATPSMLPEPSPSWHFEPKCDGQRAQVICDNGDCRIFSRSLRDITDTYPDVVAAALEAMPNQRVILDGEIVVVDPTTNAPDFGLLQTRMHARATPARLAHAPAIFAAFDLLHLANLPTTDTSYLRRRALLDGLDLGRGGRVQVLPSWGPQTDPRRLFEALIDAGHEGVVAKRIDSVYQSGRSTMWRKVVGRQRFEALVAGWLQGKGSHAQTLGALVLAGYGTDDALHYMGLVGSGFSGRARAALQMALTGLERTAPPIQAPPAVMRAARWAEPRIIAVLEAREASSEGILRHPSFKGVRSDLDPTAINMPNSGS